MIAVHDDYQFEIILHLNTDEHPSPYTKTYGLSENLDIWPMSKSKQKAEYQHFPFYIHLF